MTAIKPKQTKPVRDRDLYTNEKIPTAGIPRSSDVRLIGKDGEQLGIVKLASALDMAYDANLDLVLMSQGTVPAVVRIMDYGKFCFDRDKREKEAKKNQQKTEIKEVQISYHIGEGDFNTKLQQARKFLAAGNRVRVRVSFKGRQMAHQDVGRGVFDRFAKGIEDLGELSKKPEMEGRNLVGFFFPIKK